jgi:hypothetical protein
LRGRSRRSTSTFVLPLLNKRLWTMLSRRH